MKIIDRIAKKLGFTRQRSLAGANTSRLFSDWVTSRTTGDAELRNNLELLIQRARDLECNNDYIRRWLKLLRNNVLGSDGIGLEMRIANANGEFIENLNERIEDAWDEWGEAEYFSWDGTMCRQEMDELILERTAIDGGILLQKVYNPNNPFGLAYRPIEIDQLDLKWNQRIGEDHEIRMGVEFVNGIRVAYHIWNKHPGDFGFIAQSDRKRVPAQNILHIKRTERVNQTHGIPWCISGMASVKQISAYEEAEIVAARVAACKGMVITQAMPEGYDGEKDSRGNIIEDMEPGGTRLLNPGETAMEINPTHPNTALPEVLKWFIRKLAGGLGSSYNALGNDLSDVNYSSMRAGKLEDNEEWKTTQNWFNGAVKEPQFKDFLPLAMLGGKLEIPQMRVTSRMSRQWQCRRWGWVDPLKDMQAVELALRLKMTSISQELAEEGKDRDDVFNAIASDEAAAIDKKIGTTLLPETPTPSNNPVDNTADTAKSVRNGNGHLHLNGNRS